MNQLYVNMTFDFRPVNCTQAPVSPSEFFFEFEEFSNKTFQNLTFIKQENKIK